MKPCLTCNKVGPWGRSGRCELHRKQRVRIYESNPIRRAYKAERYDADYRATRNRWAMVIQNHSVNCARCKQPITGNFDLDHINNQLLPSHPECNRGKR